MIKFTVKRSEWNSGKNVDAAFLYNSDTKLYSTLGFLLFSLGVDSSDMDLYMYPSSLVQKRIIKSTQIPNLVELLVDNGMTNIWDDTQKAVEIINIDNSSLEENREQLISDILYSLGYEISYE